MYDGVAIFHIECYTAQQICMLVIKLSTIQSLYNRCRPVSIMATDATVLADTFPSSSRPSFSLDIVSHAVTANNVRHPSPKILSKGQQVDVSVDNRVNHIKY